MNPFVAKLQWLQAHLGAVLALLFICVAIFAGWQLVHRSSMDETLQVNGRSFSLEVADTPQAQAMGLSDRTSMPADHGMLFVFDNSAMQCFWMKDMNFSLDMIWLNAGKQVMHIEQNVSPGTYPHSYCVSAKYVLELNAGTTASTGIREGQTLNF